MGKWDDSSRDLGGANRTSWTEFQHAWNDAYVLHQLGNSLGVTDPS